MFRGGGVRGRNLQNLVFNASGFCEPDTAPAFSLSTKHFSPFHKTCIQPQKPRPSHLFPILPPTQPAFSCSS